MVIFAIKVCGACFIDRPPEWDLCVCVCVCVIIEVEVQMEKFTSASSCRSWTSAFLGTLDFVISQATSSNYFPARVNPMQRFHCARTRIPSLRNRVPIPKVLQVRPFAVPPSSGSSGFKAGKPLEPPGSPKDKAFGFNATGPSARPHKAPPKDHKAPRKERAKEAKNEEASPRRRFPIGPGKLILLSVFAFLGYKVYKWHISLARISILTPRAFTPFILKSREKVSSTSATLDLLSLPEGQNTVNVTEAWKKGVWSVQVMQPELQIARSYTPLPPIEGAKPEQVRLFVRHEPQGEVSTMLHKINRGTLVHLRGPNIEYEIPQDVDEILFLAGGTGIAPALQVAHTLFNYRTNPTKGGPELRILWANRRREDSIDGLNAFSDQGPHPDSVPTTPKLTEKAQRESPNQSRETAEGALASSKFSQTPLVEEVESLRTRHEGKVIVDYLIDEEGSYITESLLRTYLSDVDQTLNQDGTPRTKLILVSGPEGFVEAFAGPKIWQDGREIQGSLGGLLKKIDPKGWEIWKL